MVFGPKSLETLVLKALGLRFTLPVPVRGIDYVV